MKKYTRLFLVALLISFHSIKAQVVNPRFVDGEIFVKVKDTSAMNLAPYAHGDAAMNLLYTQFGIDTITRPFAGLNDTLDKTYMVRFHLHARVDTLVMGMQLLPFIEYCEKAPIFPVSGGRFIPNDLDSAKQYQLMKIFAPDAWGVTQGSTSVVLAVVDNAIRINHVDLAPNVWNNPSPGSFLDQYPNDVHGWDVSDNDNNPNPPGYVTNSSAFAHGTHCAGIADAATNNGAGISSIGFNVKLMAVKCTSDNSADSGASLTNAYDGVYYAIQAGANIISMSWGDTSGGLITGQNLINSAYSKGILMVAAAGNNNTSIPFYPAAFDHVLAVGATDPNDAKASYSNYGSYIDVMAPGNSIYSTLPGTDNSYGYNGGTSMACPLVAGLAALVKSYNPTWSPDQIIQQIKSASDNIDTENPTYTGQLGAGRINAAKALGATPTTGISALDENEKMIWLAPNPCDGHFSIYWGGKEPVDEVEVMDGIGREVMRQLSPGMSGSRMDINLSSGLAAGMYLLKTISSGKVYVYRFMIR